VQSAAELGCLPEQWTHVEEHVLECLRRADEGLLEAQAVSIDVDDEVCVGLFQGDIVKWHIQAEFDRCAPGAVPPVATSPFVWSRSPSLADNTHMAADMCCQCG
jgi:hypothetical protein